MFYSCHLMKASVNHESGTYCKHSVEGLTPNVVAIFKEDMMARDSYLFVHLKAWFLSAKKDLAKISLAGQWYRWSQTKWGTVYQGWTSFDVACFLRQRSDSSSRHNRLGSFLSSYVPYIFASKTGYAVDKDLFKAIECKKVRESEDDLIISIMKEMFKKCICVSSL